MDAGDGDQTLDGVGFDGGDAMLCGDGLIGGLAAVAERAVGGKVGPERLQKPLRGFIHGFGRQGVQHLARAFDRLDVAQRRGTSGAPGGIGGPLGRGRVAWPAMNAAYSPALLPVNMPPLAPS